MTYVERLFEILKGLISRKCKKIPINLLDQGKELKRKRAENLKLSSQKERKKMHSKIIINQKIYKLKFP